MKALVDNDICLKGLSYGLLDHFLATVPEIHDRVGVLGVARFVLTNRLQRQGAPDMRADLIHALYVFLGSAELVEPTEEEESLAAEFESLAQISGLSLDVGESQLCAVLLLRGLPLLLTGDKRAITALEGLLNSHPLLGGIGGKVKCLEQLVLDAIAVYGSDLIGQHICANSTIDRTLSICFGCASGSAVEENILEGLNSYIRDLRSQALRVLYS
jgi:hypothetical protein